jgi:hypothetical protein
VDGAGQSRGAQSQPHRARSYTTAIGGPGEAHVTVLWASRGAGLLGTLGGGMGI